MEILSCCPSQSGLFSPATRTDVALHPIQLNWTDCASKHHSSTCTKIKIFT